MSMTPQQEAAALWGWAENKAVPVEERLSAALGAVERFHALLQQAPWVELTEEVNKPTYCKVFVEERLVFYGRTFL